MENTFLLKLNANLKEILPSRKELALPKLLLAVSGGADSVCLLCALVKLKSQVNFSISVLTVNHNLRPPSESAHDANFVKNLCASLNVECAEVELDGNKLRKYARVKKCGIEAVARYFRYRALKKRAAELLADFIVTAHNQNDYYETVLMRLFQGGNPESLNSPKMKNKNRLKPLLNFSRKEILDFLKTENQNFCVDSSNSDLKFLRNRIRHVMVPALNKSFPNWQKGLDKTLEKISWDCKALDPEKFLSGGIFGADTKSPEKSFENLEFAESQNKNPNIKKQKNHKSALQKNAKFLKCTNIKKKSAEEVEIDGKLFSILPKAVRRRILMAVFSELKLMRISHEFVKSCVELEPGGKCEIGRCGVSFCKNVLVYKKTKKQLDGFAIWVNKNGRYFFPAGEFFVETSSSKEKTVSLKFKNAEQKTESLGDFVLPFYVRSIQPGDKIQIGLESFKSVKKFLSENKLPEHKFVRVPIIEKKGEILGIWGKIAGKKNRRKFREN